MKSLVQKHHLKCHLKLSEIYSNLFPKQSVFRIHHFLECVFGLFPTELSSAILYAFKIANTETQKSLFRKGCINEWCLPVNLICPASSSKMLKIKIHIHQNT